MPNTSFRLSAVLVLLVSAAAICPAQDIPTPSVPKPRTREQPIETEWESGDINGDTLVKVLREKFPDCDFLVSPEVFDLQISKIHLRHVTLQQILAAVEFASGYRLQVISNGRIVTLWGGNAARPQPQMEAFNLADFLAGNSKGEMENRVNEINRMVREAMMLIGKFSRDSSRGEAPRFSFNPDAKVLVAVGDAAGIDATRKIVNALSKNQTSGAAAEMEKVADQFNAASSQLGPNHPSVIQLRDRLDRLRKKSTDSPPVASQTPAPPKEP